MNAISLALILTILTLLPSVFLAAGKDTDRSRAIQKELQQEAMLDWTDKTLLSAERHTTGRPEKALSRSAAPSCPVTVISRDNLSPLSA